MPLFVPPGHRFLFDLGRRICLRLPARWTWPATLIMVPLVVSFAWSGLDTSGIVLLLFFCSSNGVRIPGFTSRWSGWPLAMELWGTYLGNWTWAHDVPWTPFTTTTGAM